MPVVAGAELVEVAVEVEVEVVFGGGVVVVPIVLVVAPPPPPLQLKTAGPVDDINSQCVAKHPTCVPGTV